METVSIRFSRIACRFRRWAYPDVEVEVFVGNGLDIEADCGYCGNHLPDLQAFPISHLRS